MSLKLIDSVDSILLEVQELTNKPVELIEKSDLNVYAKVKMARFKMPAHIIFYKKDHEGLINHLIAHECGHILRTFSVPEENRLIPMANSNMIHIMTNEIERDIKKLESVLSPDDINQLVNLWHSGIIQQVTSYPPDIMIEKWIYDNYSELRPYQITSIEKQRDSSMAILTDQIRAITPPKIYKIPNIMNYAFFKVIGEHIHANLVRGYNNTPYVKKGKKLASLTGQNYVDSYEGDIDMTNCWADFLNISDWFGWTKFENIPDDYLTSI